MQISGILILFALSLIVEGQWAAVAKDLYKPIILSVGTVFAAINSSSMRDYFVFKNAMVNPFFKDEDKEAKQEIQT